MRQTELFRPPEPRRATHAGRILERLRVGPVLNTELNRICFRYSARIYELRKLGHVIEVEKLADGVTRYTLKADGL